MRNSFLWALVASLALGVASMAQTPEVPSAVPVQGETGAAQSSPPKAPLRDSTTGAIAGYDPIDGRQRATWYLRETGGAAIGGAVFSAAWTTALGSPREYPATWEHFGKRWALSISGTAISNGVEVSLGSLWGEDPRYYRVNGPFQQNAKAKIKNILLSTVTATNRDGGRMPAYARYVGISSSNLMQMAWRPESQSSVGDAFVRMGYGLLGRMSANAFDELLPDLREAFARRKKPANNP